MTLRIGILGTAQIARNMHIPAFAEVKAVRLSAIASRSAASAEAFAADFEIAHAFGSYKALIESPVVDAVLIALPNSLHAEWAIKAANAGKHVLCEKPMALSEAEANAIIEAGERNGVTILEGFTHLLTPAMEFAVNAIRSGEYGKPLSVRAELTYPLADWENDSRAKAELAGGALWDCGCYGVSAIRHLLGAEPSSLSATQVIRHPNNVDQTFSAFMSFPSINASAYVLASMAAPFRAVAEIVCETASIIIPQFFAGNKVSIQKGPANIAEHAVGDLNRFAKQLAHFTAVVHGEESPVFSLQSSRSNATVLSKLKEAAITL